ncbi:MAG: hypothetical protein RI909_120 [Bacteroidota bacterium]|jgi:putative effector of murein hydrolase LrgA (UPF0299 family)
MIEFCILGMVLFYTLFFYTVIKFQHIETGRHAHQLDVTKA